ncbi:hypothetical protein B0I37DRAFT_364659 [Chaetomium sp. MPI-CAGE-AT-0009]|nr:hypothetical protein B0I37DRAFT_364659 [Chaetomium sp. MPI-CAGE-AT-0009]
MHKLIQPPLPLTAVIGGFVCRLGLAVKACETEKWRGPGRGKDLPRLPVLWLADKGPGVGRSERGSPSTDRPGRSLGPSKIAIELWEVRWE